MLESLCTRSRLEFRFCWYGLGEPTSFLLLFNCKVLSDWLFVTPWTAAHQAFLSFTISQSLLKLMSIESVVLSNPLNLCCPLLFLPSFFPSIRIFSNSVSQLFASGGQSIGDSASASALPVNIQGWFPLGWTALISLLSKGLSRVFSRTIVWKHQFFCAQPSSWSHIFIFISLYFLSYKVETACSHAELWPPCKCSPKCQLREPSRFWLLATLFSGSRSPWPLYPLIEYFHFLG